MHRFFQLRLEPPLDRCTSGAEINFIQKDRAMPQPAQPYSMNMDISPGDLQTIDLPQIAAAVTDPWFNQSLVRINDCVVRLGVVQGEFHWHKHDREDEFFLVIEGELSIDLDDGSTVRLAPDQAYAVPRGQLHRTQAPQRTVILMIEGATVTPTGDA
jgi:mannose-6-phosphate isomerase-like protein (cupin superfamily)